MNTVLKKEIFPPAWIGTTLQKLAAQVSQFEAKHGPFDIVGIHRRGVVLAQRLIPLLDQLNNTAQSKVQKSERRFGTLDISLYRDDLGQAFAMPVLRETAIPFDVQDARILLVDDVLYTGRTVRSALNALMDLGRPRHIALLVLIDRGGRELPIQADFVGAQYEVPSQSSIEVFLHDVDQAASEGVFQIG